MKRQNKKESNTIGTMIFAIEAQFWMSTGIGSGPQQSFSSLMSFRQL